MKKAILVCCLMLWGVSTCASEIDLIQSHLDRGHIERAEKMFFALSTEQQEQLSGQLFKVELLSRQYKYESAYDLMEELAEKHPNNVKVQYLLGLANVNMIEEVSFFSKLGYAKDALSAWKAAEKLSPNDIDVKIALAQYYAQAPGIADGDDDLAIEYAEKVLQMDPAEGYPLLLTLHSQMDNKVKAEQLFNQGLEELSDVSELYYLRAIRWVSDEKWSDAFADLKLGLEKTQNPEHIAKLHYQLGRIAVLSEQQLKLGIDSLQTLKSGEFNPSGKWTDLRLAQLYLMSDEPDKANALVANLSSHDKKLNKEAKKLRRKVKRALKKAKS